MTLEILTTNSDKHCRFTKFSEKVKMDEYKLFGKIFLILFLNFPQIHAESELSIKNRPLQPYNIRVPQFKMVHMNGDLGETTFAAFRHLTGLEIERCAINYLTPVTFKNTPLEILDIHDNIEFPTITSSMFEYLQKLRVFRLTFNPYTEIEEGAFETMKNLDVLVISHQNLKNLTKGFLEGLVNLRELSLTFNEIEYVDPNSFEHMKELTAIYLGHNFIKTLTLDTFKNQHKLEDLQLQDNLLGNEKNSYSIDWRKFDRLIHLRSLNIAGNHFRYLHIQDLMTNFPLLESINFLPNNLTCSSELYITKTLRQYKIQIEYYGNDYSNCRTYDFVRLGETVFDD